MTNVELRSYNPDADYENLCSLLQEAGLFDTDYESEEQLRRWVEIQPDSIILAKKDGRIVGNIYFQDGIIPHIFRLAVAKDLQGQGIGSELLSEAEQRAKNLGHQFIELFIVPEHPELIDWYKNHGYETRGTYTDMVKQLSHS
jgi:predicted N-acetyltransferase YhbS